MEALRKSVGGAGSESKGPKESGKKPRMRQPARRRC
jgi:hypothetical protein